MLEKRKGYDILSSLVFYASPFLNGRCGKAWTRSLVAHVLKDEDGLGLEVSHVSKVKMDEGALTASNSRQ